MEKGLLLCVVVAVICQSVAIKFPHRRAFQTDRRFWVAFSMLTQTSPTVGF